MFVKNQGIISTTTFADTTRLNELNEYFSYWENILIKTTSHGLEQKSVLPKRT